MKKFIYYFLCQVFFVLASYAQSSITYDAGTSIEIDLRADVCADAVIINGTHTGTGTICAGPLPVTISSFLASVDRNNAILNWTTVTELNNSGFDIERKSIKETSWYKIGFVHGNGTTNIHKNYLFEDKKLSVGNYQYRLKQIDYNGNFNYYNLVNDVVVSAPHNFSMAQNYPNPSNPKTKIDYEIPINGKVSIKLYNMIGQEVVDIVNEVKEAGYYSAEFDGTNFASGVYFYRILSEGNGQKFTKTMKMVLVK